MSDEKYKFRYTFTVEVECSKDNYPDPNSSEDYVSPLEIEKGNAPDVIFMELSDGNGEIKVEQIQ